MLRINLITTLLCLLFFQPCLAFAANKYSVSFGYGNAYYTTDISGINISGAFRVNDFDSQHKITFGYNFNNYFTTELYYADLGKVEVTGDAGNSFTHNGTTKTFTANNSEYIYDYTAVGANAILSTDSNIMSIYAKIGVLYWMDDHHMLSAGVISDSGSASGFAPLVGIGYKYSLFPNTSIRIEYDMTKFDNNNLTLTGADVVVSF